jgi:C1A family cysteine protease
MQILITGYNKTEDGISYWKLKNSVGTDWGINGTMLLAMGDKAQGSGKCGIQLFGTMPINKT